MPIEPMAVYGRKTDLGSRCKRYRAKSKNKQCVYKYLPIGRRHFDPSARVSMGWQ
jgi:hypothetical protein